MGPHDSGIDIEHVLFLQPKSGLALVEEGDLTMTSSRAIGVEMAHCLTFPLATVPDVALTVLRLENLLHQRFQITLVTGGQAALQHGLLLQARLQSWSLLGDEAPDFEARKAVLQALLIQTMFG